SGFGIRLVSVSGALAAPTGSISGAAGITFDAELTTGTFSYGGSLSNNAGSGLLVNILGQNAGTLTLSGNLNANGGGIAVSSSVAGAVTNFTGTSKIVNAPVSTNHPS